MKTEFTVTLQIAPNTWCDPLIACDNTRVWSNTNLWSFKLSCLGVKVCVGNITSR